MTLPRILVALLSLLPTPLRRRLVLWMIRRLMGAHASPSRRHRHARLAWRLADLPSAAATAARAIRGVLQTLGSRTKDELAVLGQAARLRLGALGMAVAADFAATRAAFAPLRAPVPSGAALAATAVDRKEPPTAARSTFRSAWFLSRLGLGLDLKPLVQALPWSPPSPAPTR